MSSTPNKDGGEVLSWLQTIHPIVPSPPSYIPIDVPSALPTTQIQPSYKGTPLATLVSPTALHSCPMQLASDSTAEKSRST